MPDHVSCPVAVVAAPRDLVWGVLTDPAGWGDFYDVRIKDVNPPGAARVGQKVRAETGPPFLHSTVEFEFLAVEHQKGGLAMAIRLPFGISVREEVDCTPLSDESCRVRCNCAFGVSARWPSLLRPLLRRAFDRGAEDSLRRLKRFAEMRHTSPIRK
jgi:polyketide cyclase/dehydrase/lipid transport protein